MSSNSQVKNGTYIGKSIKYWKSPAKIIDGTPNYTTILAQKDVSAPIDYTPTYINTKLTITGKGHFWFEYYDVVKCSYTPQRYCAGTYSIINDTLTLNSKYKLSQFYNVQYSNTNQITSDSILLIIKGERLWSFSVEADDIIQGDGILGFGGGFRDGDSIWIHKHTSIIKITSECPDHMDWIIPLNKEKKENKILLKLQTDIENQNLSIENVRILINRNKLIMLDSFYFKDIENNLFIRKNVFTKNNR